MSDLVSVFNWCILLTRLISRRSLYLLRRFRSRSYSKRYFLIQKYKMQCSAKMVCTTPNMHACAHVDIVYEQYTGCYLATTSFQTSAIRWLPLHTRFKNLIEPTIIFMVKGRLTFFLIITAFLPLDPTFTVSSERDHVQESYKAQSSVDRIVSCNKNSINSCHNNKIIK